MNIAIRNLIQNFWRFKVGMRFFNSILTKSSNFDKRRLVHNIWNVQRATRSTNGLPPQGVMTLHVTQNLLTTTHFHCAHSQWKILIESWKKRIYQVEDGQYRNRRASWPVASYPSAAICSWPWHSNRVVAESYSKRASGGSIDICSSTPFGRC